ncbi:MAG TPA: MFS transporter [Streptosporangiaceae bacterium]|nr:MFS transporter [Streptosporangiaceae bacterium]
MSSEADSPAGRVAQRSGPPGWRPQPSSFTADLRAVLAEREFRKLFATRLISQTGDGVFNAGLGAYVFFNATTFPDPVAATVAFAVLYLPYSLIGPFAGVFIDRWSRRQILVWSALIRFAFVVLAATFVASGTLGVPLYIGALLVLGVNRFFLSSLSAALPHVVSSDKLVMANSVAPTSGTIVAFVGGIAGLGVHVITGGGQAGSAATLLVGGLCYVCAGLVALRIPRNLLGPTASEIRQAGGIGAELAGVARGLAAGARHVARRRRAAAALTATASHRFLYGILLLMSVLLYRNFFYHDVGSNNALGHFILVVVASAIGYGTAAVITPVITQRVAKASYIAAMLILGGLATAALGTGFRQPGFLAIGFVLGLAAQGIAICATTILQQQSQDAFRGRVFSLYDMLFNASFVAGAALSAAFMPMTGRSYPLLLVVAIGYLAAAWAYRLISGQFPDGPEGGSEPAGGTDGSAAGTPSAAAQSRSS